MLTDRLRLRRFKETDVDFLFTLNNDKEVNKYRSRSEMSKIECLNDIKMWNKKYQDHFLNVYLVELITSSTPLGMIFLVDCQENTVELGYRFLKDEWRKGYCYESASSLINQYFKLNEDGIVVAETDQRNIGSINLLLKLGFKALENAGSNNGKLFELLNQKGG